MSQIPPAPPSLPPSAPAVAVDPRSAREGLLVVALVPAGVVVVLPFLALFPLIYSYDSGPSAYGFHAVLVAGVTTLLAWGLAAAAITVSVLAIRRVRGTSRVAMPIIALVVTGVTCVVGPVVYFLVALSSHGAYSYDMP